MYLNCQLANQRLESAEPIGSRDVGGRDDIDGGIALEYEIDRVLGPTKRCADPGGRVGPKGHRPSDASGRLTNAALDLTPKRFRDVRTLRH